MAIIPPYQVKLTPEYLPRGTQDITNTIKTISNNLNNTQSATYAIQNQAKFYPSATKYSFNFNQLSAAATTIQFLIFNLPAKAAITQTVVKHNAAFAGTGITAASVQVGNNSIANKYASSFNVFQTPGSGVFLVSSTFGMEDFASAEPIYLTLTTTGGNTSALTQGEVDIYLFVVQLPS